MVSNVVAALLVGASAVSAVPFGPLNNIKFSQRDTSNSTTTTSTGQTPFTFPLANGFPAPSEEVLFEIEQAAHGTLPNGPFPTALAADSTLTLQLIAFNEIFEVAFFTSLLNNITNGVSGFEVADADEKAELVAALTAIQAQEELHYLGANAILSGAGETPIQPCQYVFPTDNVADAVALASTFTDVVLGTLAASLGTFSSDGDGALNPLVGSIIAQEGEQDGYFRSFGDKIPSQSPFLTLSVGSFAFTVLNELFVVAGSCPNSNLITIPVNEPLTITTPVTEAVNQAVQFTVASSGFSGSLADDYSVVFISNENLPFKSPILNVMNVGDSVTFESEYSFTNFVADGLTLAIVVKGTNTFDSVADAAAAAVFGPAIIEIS